MMPDFKFEMIHWKRGLKYVAGADEVGRGSFAGPVVTACVVFDTLRGTTLQGSTKVKIDDSKKLSEKQRETADVWIRKNALAFGVGRGSVWQINKLGIKKATEIAYRKAVGKVNEILRYKDTKKKEVSPSILISKYPHIEHLLLDAFFIPHLKGSLIGRTKNFEYNNISKIKYGSKQTAIVKGDQMSFSIASASIIAKVYRDNLMTKLSLKKTFEVYKWHKNKGYGTKAHQNAIFQFGISKHHRKDYIKKTVKLFNS